MEKLLHERLQQYSADDLSFGLLDGTRVSALYAREAKAIANEIEHYYIPRPRFEDGKPVQFGDDIEIHNQSGLLDKGIIRSFHPNKGPVWMLSLVGCDHERLVRFDPKTCIIKRPAPKVLDADRVEIKVGETLYRITTGEPVTVEALENVKYMEVLDAKGDSWNAQSLTHERPVFDVNDERICKGDTVWDLDSGERLHVEEFVNRECGLVQCSNEEDGDCEDHDARRLTHREPDSLEKLRDDLYTLAARDDGDIEVEIVIFADRLTALIERGA